jgi:hypothetical protein
MVGDTSPLAIDKTEDHAAFAHIAPWVTQKNQRQITQVRRTPRTPPELHAPADTLARARALPHASLAATCHARWRKSASMSTRRELRRACSSGGVRGVRRIYVVMPYTGVTQGVTWALLY